VRIRFRLTAFSVLAVTSCSSPTGNGGFEPAPPPGFSLFGRVQTAAGAAITTATFAATGTIGRCGTNRGPATLAPRASIIDAMGAYRLTLDATVIDTICLRFVARQSASSNADSVVAPATTVAIKPNEFRDSVRFDFVFP
jgi:hypothetical protein